MLRNVLLVCCLLFPLGVQAQALAPKTLRHQYFNSSTGSKKLLAAVAANASSSSRTVTLTTKDYARLVFQVDYTWATGTAVTMTCQGSLNNGSSYANVNTASVLAGAVTLATATWSKAVTASTNELVSVDTSTYDFLKCVFSATAGGGSDLFDVYAISAAGL